MISACLGRMVKPSIITLEAYVESLIKAGLPKAYADRFGEFYDVTIKGFNEPVTDVVEQVTGHGARSFKDYAAHYFSRTGL